MHFQVDHDTISITKFPSVKQCLQSTELKVTWMRSVNTPIFIFSVSTRAGQLHAFLSCTTIILSCIKAVFIVSSIIVNVSCSLPFSHNKSKTPPVNGHCPVLRPINRYYVNKILQARLPQPNIIRATSTTNWPVRVRRLEDWWWGEAASPEGDHRKGTFEKVRAVRVAATEYLRMMWR